MKNCLFILLLLFTCSVIALGADRIAFRGAIPAASDAGISHFHVGLLDSTIDPRKRSIRSEDESDLPTENLRPVELYLSLREEFDPVFNEASVLQVVTRTLRQGWKHSQETTSTHSSSLRRLNVMLQV